MAILVKICGINSADAADAAVRAGVNFAGMMFHQKSPRNVEMAQAVALSGRMRGRVRLVAVMSDPADETLGAVIGAVKPDFIQLHGVETAARVGAIRSRFGVPVLKVISVADTGDLAGAAAYEEAADMLMFDAKAPVGAAREGGHGTVFDWRLLRGRNFSKPWLLAGGLNAENVARAIAASGAVAVDVSSGVESAPGVKSTVLIGEFIMAARTPEKVRA